MNLLNSQSPLYNINFKNIFMSFHVAAVKLVFFCFINVSEFEFNGIFFCRRVGSCSISNSVSVGGAHSAVLNDIFHFVHSPV